MKIICYLFTKHHKKIKTRRIMRRPKGFSFRAVAEKVRQTKRGVQLRAQNLQLAGQGVSREHPRTVHA